MKRRLDEISCIKIILIYEAKRRRPVPLSQAATALTLRLRYEAGGSAEMPGASVTIISAGRQVSRRRGDRRATAGHATSIATPPGRASRQASFKPTQRRRPRRSFIIRPARRADGDTIKSAMMADTIY